VLVFTGDVHLLEGQGTERKSLGGVPVDANPFAFVKAVLECGSEKLLNLLVLNLKNCQLQVERVGKRDANLASSGDRARGAGPVSRGYLNGDGGAVKNTLIGSVLEKFSPYTVSIFDACRLGLDNTDCAPCAWCFGASATRSGGRYLTSAGNGVMGFVGTGNTPGVFWLSNSTGGM
jgi:hypothetical protein